MQVVNDDDTWRRAPAAGPGSNVIVGRRACALLGDVGEVLTQLATRLMVDRERRYHAGLQRRLSTSVEKKQQHDR